MSHTASGSPDGIRATGRLLASLLTQRGPYRRRWEQRLGRALPDGALNKAAVAKVIAAHLWDTGERPDTDAGLPRKIKDRVYRALSGELISAETLTWFVEAFDMAGDDRDRLWTLRFPDAAGPIGPVVDSLRHPQFVPLPQRHRTIAVFERRLIGADGTVIGHRTTSAVLACEDGVTGYPYRLVRGARAVRVRHGGRVTTRHEFSGAAPVIEITFNTPLRRGQVASLEYDVEFARQAQCSSEYRRVAHSRCENVDIIVQFAPEHRPSQVWWTVWDNYRGGEIVHQEPAPLDVETCAHRYVPYMEHAAAGFRWIW
ncbi:hypothetical protein [Actinomadura bangladeshensis]|uniref:Uncharacterized protein n=1 Tax=Actinomadura bangladeshensis TaxID=453573 RepID=A0A4R4P3K7_9ACTN|nr:hypothetical protein [Actinomadura bangladeshensis]TDC16575.1 hypothetical protein E1284_11985 [Actinomadura bangladeshensis]